MTTRFVQGEQLPLLPVQHNEALLIFTEPCTIELPNKGKAQRMVTEFLPLGGVELTLVCHGDDTLSDGETDSQRAVISKQERHTVVCLDKFYTTFPVEPPAEPEPVTVSIGGEDEQAE